MNKKLTITATLTMALIFGTVLMPQTTSATTLTKFTPITQDNCVVVGNNDIPLNVRKSPNGKIIGKLKVGSDIVAYDLVTDKNGDYWTKIKYKKGFGYVLTRFISCG